MSWKRIVRITCDDERCLESVDTAELKVGPARKRAKEWGWTRAAGGDRCPRCTGYRIRCDIAYPRVRAESSPGADR